MTEAHAMVFVIDGGCADARITQEPHWLSSVAVADSPCQPMMGISWLRL